MCCNCDSKFPKQYTTFSLTQVVLFSAIVIQWVTSKDNAGTSSTTSSGGGNADNGVRHVPQRDGSTGPTRGYAARQRNNSPPSTPAEMSLVTTARCSHGDYDEETWDSTTGPKLSGPDRPGVMVTTTIERQSTPIGRGVFVDGSECDGDDMFSGSLSRSSRSASWASSYAGTQKGSRGPAFPCGT